MTAPTTDTTAGNDPGTAPAWSPLGGRTFWLMWTGESASRLGFQLSSFLLPLLAVTLLHASGTEVGAISAAQFLPVVGFALVAGALTSRLPLRWLLVVCSSVRAGVIGLLALAHTWSHLSLWHLVVAAAVIGTATVFYDVAFQAGVPLVVPAGSIARANGLMQATYSLTQLAGPALAGLTMEQLGASLALSVAVAAFAGAILSFLAIAPRVFDRRSTGEVTSVARSIGRGLRFVWRCRPIRDLCLQAGLFNLFEQALLTAFMVYAVAGLDLSGATVGLVIGAGSIGALVGSLSAPHVPWARARVGWLVLGALPLAGLAFVLLPLSLSLFGGAALPLAAAFVLNGVALSFFNVFAVSLRQSIPPEQMLGPATASYRLVSFGTIPIGAVLGGLAIDVLGGQTALWAISITMVVLSLGFLGSPLRRLPSVDSAREFSRPWTEGTLA